MDERHSTGETSNTAGNWWEALQAPLPPTTRQYLQRVFGLSQSYAEFAQRFVANADAEAALDNWLEDLEQLWEGVAESDSTSAADADTDSLGLWSFPLDTWQRTVASLLATGAGTHEQLHGVGAGILTSLDRLLATPAIGYTREYQEQSQRYSALLLRYMTALQDYQRALARVGLRSIEIFREKLAHPDSHPPIDSLRVLYDIWVDASETAYVEYAISPDHSRRFGKLVNALAALKREASLLLDRMLESANLPTRREVDTMHRYLHDTRRQNQSLRVELDHLKQRIPTPPAAARKSPRARTKTRHH